MLMTTVNYPRVIDWEQNITQLQEKAPKWQEKAYEGLPIFRLVEINLQKWQTALALMSP